MKHLIFSLIVLVAAPAFGQDKPMAKEAAKPEAVKAAEKKDPARQAAAGARKPRRWNEDARHCLQLPTNTEIIKCAEEYL